MEQSPNVIPFPRFHLIKGLAQLAFHRVFDQFQHPSLSDHNLNYHLLDKPEHITFDSTMGATVDARTETNSTTGLAS